MPLWTYQRRARLAGPRLPSMLRGAPRDLLTLFILPLICLIALAEPASGDPRQLARARWEATEHDITSSITAGVAEELLRTEHQPQQSELNSTMDDGDFNDFLFRRSLWAPKPGRSRRAPGSPPQPPLPLAQPLSLQVSTLSDHPSPSRNQFLMIAIFDLARMT